MRLLKIGAVAVGLLTILLGCQSQTPVSESTSPSSTEPPVILFTPSLSAPDYGGAPATSFQLTGEGFPPNESIQIVLAHKNLLLATDTTDEEGQFDLDLIVPILGQSGDINAVDMVEIIAQTSDNIASADIKLDLIYDDALVTADLETLGITIPLPSNWEIQAPQMTPLGQMVLIGPSPVVPGDPTVSMILSVPTDQLDLLSAVDLLVCGEIGCEADVTLFRDEINGLSMRRVEIGPESSPKLSWYFIEDRDQLVFLTLNDPVTLESLRPLIGEIEWISAEGAMAEADALVDDDAIDVDHEAAESEVAQIVIDPMVDPTAIAEPEVTPTDPPVTEESATATPTPVPTATLTPTPLPTRVETEDIGPLQTVINLLSDVARNEVSGVTVEYLSAELRRSVESPEDVRELLDVDFFFVRFDVERVLIDGVVVDALLENNANATTRRLTLIREDDRWRVNQIQSLEDPEPTLDASDTEETTTPEATIEGGTEDSSETETPEPTQTPEGAGYPDP